MPGEPPPRFTGSLFPKDVCNWHPPANCEEVLNVNNVTSFFRKLDYCLFSRNDAGSSPDDVTHEGEGGI